MATRRLILTWILALCAITIPCHGYYSQSKPYVPRERRSRTSTSIFTIHSVPKTPVLSWSLVLTSPPPSTAHRFHSAVFMPPMIPSLLVLGFHHPGCVNFGGLLGYRVLEESYNGDGTSGCRGGRKREIQDGQRVRKV